MLVAEILSEIWIRISDTLHVERRSGCKVADGGLVGEVEFTPPRSGCGSRLAFL